jgi:hypothetical protein
LFVKTGDAFFAIFTHTPQNATPGDSERSNDVSLFAGTLHTQLCGEHAKRSQISFRMLEHGLRAAEIEPLSILPHDADQITNASRIVGDEWQ